MISEPIVHAPSLVDAVSERLQRLVAEGPLQAGDRLPREADLVSSLGVSRTVLREALKRLEGVGLVTIQRGRGRGVFIGERGGITSCVKMIRSALAISPKELLKFTELRRILECHAARRAAELAGPDDMAALRALCDRMSSKDVDYATAIRLDFEFHIKLMEIAGNEVIRNVMETLQEFIKAGMVTATEHPKNRKARRNLHVRILDAIRKGDPDAAEGAMKAHMMVVERGIREAESWTGRSGHKSS